MNVNMWEKKGWRWKYAWILKQSRRITCSSSFTKTNVFSYIRRKETYKRGMMGWNYFWMCILIFIHFTKTFFSIYPSFKEKEVKARHHGLKWYLKEHSYFPTLQEDECFYLCSSKGDVQARYNGTKSFQKEYSYFSYSS